MTITEDAYRMIRRWEGFRPTWYEDSVGVQTIGYGTTHRLLDELQLATVEGPISNEEGQALLEATIVQHFAPKLDRTLPKGLPQHTQDAIMSFVYNVGLSAFENSTMHKLYNKGKMDAAADEFEEWVYVTPPDEPPKKLDGLVERRTEEAALARSGIVPWAEEDDEDTWVPDVDTVEAIPVADVAYHSPGEIDVPDTVRAEATA
jgi:lysozyme